MNKWIAAMLMLFLASCGSKQDYQTTKNGIKYKIYPGKGKDSIKNGDLVRVNIMEYYEDSALSEADETADQFVRVDTSAVQIPLFAIITKMKVDDSLVIVYPIDSVAKNNKDKVPYPWMKRGKNIYVGTKVIKKYKTEEEGRADYDKEMARMQEIFISKDSVNRSKADAELAKLSGDYKDAVKTTSGTLVKIIKQGDGPQCDSGKVVNILYEGRLVNGTVFDGNMKKDETGNTKPPFEFQLGVYPVIRGWFEGLQQLKKGAKAQFLIPWSAAYGPQGNQGIPPYSNLIFDIEVADVKNADAPQAKQPVKPQ